jgi:hypothetical protein
MKQTSKVYTTRSEKVLDFVIGFIGWFMVNGLMYTLLVQLLGLAEPDTQSSLAVLVLLVLPLVINVAAMIFFGFARRWVALGALAAFGSLLALVVVLGVLAAAFCFNSGSFR